MHLLKEITNTEADVNALRIKLQDIIDQHDLQILLSEDGEEVFNLNKNIVLA